MMSTVPFVTVQPDVAQALPPWAQILFGSGITVGSLTAIVLNVVFHHIGSGRGPAVAGTPGDTVRLAEVNAMVAGYGVDLALRVGLNTGEVLAGRVG